MNSSQNINVCVCLFVCVQYTYIIQGWSMFVLMVNFVLWHCSFSITVIVLYQYFTKTITVIGESQCHNRHLGITTNIYPPEGGDWRSTIAPLKCNDVYTRVTVAANNYDCPQPDPGAAVWSSRTTLGRAGKNRQSIIICRYRAIVPSGAVHQQT